MNANRNHSAVRVWSAAVAGLVRRALTLAVPLLAAAIVGASEVAGNASGATDWVGDFAVLRRELPARHKNLFFQTPPAAFHAALSALERDLPGLDDGEVVLRLQEIIAQLGDDHSGIVLPRREGAAAPAMLPLAVHRFSDGWHIIATDRSQEALLSTKIIALGDVPMSEVETRIGRLLSPQHPFFVRARLPQALPQASVLRHLGLTRGDTIAMTVEAPEGEVRRVIVPLAPIAPGSARVQYRPAHVAPTLANQSAVLWHRVFPDQRIFFIQYNRCEGREIAERRGDRAAAARLPVLTDLFNAALADLRAALAAGDVDHLVIDLRLNPGGASDFGTRFARELATLEALRAPGRSYVMIGRRTFSSAIINALDFRRALNARFVGEPTSGTANHYGEVRTFTLPSSGAIVSYSRKYFGEPGAALKPLQPEIPAPLSFADFAAGRDRAFEAIVADLAKGNARPSPPPAGSASPRL